MNKTVFHRGLLQQACDFSYTKDEATNTITIR